MQSIPLLELYSDSLKFKYYNIWDDQIDEMICGESYSYSLPSIFLEVILGEPKMLGAGFTSYPECQFRFHIADMFLNKEDYMEQNTQVFEIRDSAKNILQNLNISYCSTFIPIEDKMDYKHGNVYKYILGFKTNFIDNAGSVDYPGNATWGYLVNPTLNINIFKTWFGGIEYVQDVNVIVYRGDIYICSLSNSDLIFDVTKWLKITLWQPNLEFSLDSHCVYQSIVYKCTEANEDYTFDINKWLKITRG